MTIMNPQDSFEDAARDRIQKIDVILDAVFRLGHNFGKFDSEEQESFFHFGLKIAQHAVVLP